MNETNSNVNDDFYAVAFSQRAEISSFTRENVALKLKCKLWLSDLLSCKIPLARKMPLSGNSLKGKICDNTKLLMETA